MGTNFYTTIGDACECCGRGEEELHIGKSSSGWVFALHVYPERGINTLDDWKVYLDGRTITDEYGRDLSLDEMVSRITERSHPLGLQRYEDRYCAGHGEGSWDYITGEFS